MKTDITTAAVYGFGFLDHPLESKTSAITFAIALMIFVGAVLVLARSYYITVTRAWCSSFQCDREHHACRGMKVTQSQSAADAHLPLLNLLADHKPAAIPPYSEMASTRSTTHYKHPSLRIPTIGMVYESGLAQRRRTSIMESAGAGASSITMALEEAEDN